MWGKGENMTKNSNRAAMASVIITVAMSMGNTFWTDAIIGKVVAVVDGDTLTVLSVHD